MREGLNWGERRVKYEVREGLKIGVREGLNMG